MSIFPINGRLPGMMALGSGYPEADISAGPVRGEYFHWQLQIYAAFKAVCAGFQ
jgi:hypothetical protein